MITDTSKIQELIQADLDGELSVTDRAELARQLLQDPEIRRLQNEFRKMDQLLRDIGNADVPPGLRAAILSAPYLSVRHVDPRHRYDRPSYRIAAAILGGLLIVGLSYVLLDGNAPVMNLKGSLGAAGGTNTTGLITPQDHLSMRADGVEVSVSLRRDGQGLRLELNATTTVPCEVIARIDPATTILVGSPDGARLNAASGQVTVQLATGKQDFVLNFAGVAPIQLELRSGGQLLDEGRLSIGDR